MGYEHQLQVQVCFELHTVLKETDEFPIGVVFQLVTYCGDVQVCRNWSTHIQQLDFTTAQVEYFPPGRCFEEVLSNCQHLVVLAFGSLAQSFVSEEVIQLAL